MKPARVELAPPGGNPTFVVRAPFAVAPKSERGSKMVATEKVMAKELLSLEDGTKKRNLQFYTALDEVEEHSRRWEVKLREEEREAAMQHQQLVQLFDEFLTTTVFAEKKAIVADVERFHTEKLPPQELKMSNSEQSTEFFVADTIPSVIDRQSGIVSRKLKKARDTFDIENAKVSKREQKIVQRFQKHAQRTAQAFEDERATRLSKFMLLSEDVDDNERWSDRTEEQRVRKVVAEVASMRKLLATQEAARAREDASLLDSMLYAQQQLQAAVLHSFGEGAKNTGEDD